MKSFAALLIGLAHLALASDAPKSGFYFDNGEMIIDRPLETLLDLS